MTEMIQRKVDYIFRGTSPRIERPVFGPGWEGKCPPPAGGYGILRNGDRYAILVEGLRLSTPTGATRIFAGQNGFVAVGEAGSAMEWADRFGRKYQATPDGVRPVEVPNV